MRFPTEGSMRRCALIGATLALLICSLAYAQEKAPAAARPSAQEKTSAPEKPPAQEKVIIPASAERHLREAVAFEKDGNVENAIAEYKTAIKEYPDYAAAH